MLLRERLAKAFAMPSQKQELVVQPPEIPTELYSSLVRGDGRAVETVSQALGRSSPKGADGLRQLIEEVSPSRRGFLKGMGGSAAHLIMPSPLKFLQATEDALRPRLTAELTPYEMMEYSKKRLDSPIDASLKAGAPDFEEYLRDFLEIQGRPLTVRDAIQNWGEFDGGAAGLKHILKDIGLEPTQQNTTSFDKMLSAAEPFSPGYIDAGWDDMRDLARDMAAGGYENTDDIIGSIQKDFGYVPSDWSKDFDHPIVRKNQGVALDAVKAPDDFEANLNLFLKSLHKDKVPANAMNAEVSFTDNRRYFDEQVEDKMYDSGFDYDYINEVSDDLLNWMKEQDGLELKKTLDGYVNDRDLGRVMDEDVMNAIEAFSKDPTPENKQKAMASVKQYASDDEETLPGADRYEGALDPGKDFAPAKFLKALSAEDTSWALERFIQNMDTVRSQYGEEFADRLEKVYNGVGDKDRLIRSLKEGDYLFDDENQPVPPK